MLLPEAVITMTICKHHQIVSDELDQALSTIAEEYDENVETPLKVCTMTLQFDTATFTDFEDIFKQAYPEQKTFKNCVTTKLKKTAEHGNICIKVFRNRRVFLAGCTDIKMAVRLISQEFPKAVLTSVVIHMLNASLRFSWNVDMLLAFEMLQKRDCYVSYDTSIHAAINIKFVKTNISGTVLLYRTGAVVMAGFKDAMQIVLAFRFVREFFNEVTGCAVLRVKEIRVLKKRGRKSNKTKEEFYDFLLSHI